MPGVPHKACTGHGPEMGPRVALRSSPLPAWPEGIYVPPQGPRGAMGQGHADREGTQDPSPTKDAEALRVARAETGFGRGWGRGAAGARLGETRVLQEASAFPPPPTSGRRTVAGPEAANCHQCHRAH